MAYKYKFMRTIAEKIRNGEIPEDLDIEEVIKFWYSHRGTPGKKYEFWTNKPRFYNRALSANTRAKKFGVEGRINHEILERIYAKHDGKCAMCGKTEFLVFDHIIPYYRGGDNIEDNLQLLCRMCNMEKGVN